MSPKESLTTKSLHSDINFFDIVSGVLLGDTLEPFLFICLDFVIRTLMVLINGFTLRKWGRRNPAETMTDTVYANEDVYLPM